MGLTAPRSVRIRSASVSSPAGYGYNVELLREEIGEILGISQGHTVVVLGAGNLGRALMENFKFASNGFQLLAAFDVGESVVGTTIGGVNVYHVDQLEEYLSAHKVSVGLLTLPQRAAQGVARPAGGRGSPGGSGTSPTGRSASPARMWRWKTYIFLTAC